MVSKHERNVNPGNAEATQREVRAGGSGANDGDFPCVSLEMDEREANPIGDGERLYSPTLAELVRELDRELAYLNGLLELPRILLFMSKRT